MSVLGRSYIRVVFVTIGAGLLAAALLQGTQHPADTRPHLIAPIFLDTGPHGIRSLLYFAFVGDGDSFYPPDDEYDQTDRRFYVREYHPSGESNCVAGYPAYPNEVNVKWPTLDLAIGQCTENAWLRIRFQEVRQFHAFVETTHRSRDVPPFLTQVVAPTREFRLIARTETGIAIVNPTDKAQDVTVVYTHGGTPPLTSRQNTLTIDPWAKVSRFLSELVDLEDLDDPPWGVVQVQGETEIAVAAVAYSRETDWFQTLLVSPQPSSSTQ